MMLITLVRHGAVDGPPALYGHTDIALSDAGRESLRKSLFGCNTPTHIMSSPLIRCAETARELAATLQTPLDIEDNLREMNFGKWDGVAFFKDDPDWPQKEKFWENPALNTTPDGESLANMAERVFTALHDIMSLQTQHLLIVTHGGVIRLLLSGLFTLDWRSASLYNSFLVEYASTIQLVIKNRQPSIHSAKGISFKGSAPVELKVLEAQMARCQKP